MKDTHLNSNDKLQLIGDIKISIFLALLFSVAIMIVFGLIIGFIFLFGKPSDGFVTRSIYIIGISFFPLLAVSRTNILKYIDLKNGKKLIIKTNDYVVINKKDTAYILTRDNNKQKVKIDNELVPLIKSSQPLTIEISCFAKSLLFISNNNENLLDKLYIDENK